MIKEIRGQISGKGRKFCIVASEFNDFITARLLDSAVDALKKQQVKEEDITVLWVPETGKSASTRDFNWSREPFLSKMPWKSWNV